LYMPVKTYHNNNFSSGLLSQFFSMQSILDVFVVQGLISHQDAEKLKQTYHSSKDIERVLLGNRIVTRETINKAYSILLKLPYVSIVNTRIDKDVIAIIPKKLSQQYGVIAFGLKDNTLQIAISRPSELDNSFNASLDELIKSKKIKIDLFITGPEDFSQAIKQYGGDSKNLKLSTTSYPVVYLRNQNLSAYLLHRLPFDFVQKHRAVIFYQKSDKTFALAAEKPDNSDVRKAIAYLEKENKIKVQLFATSKEDIDYAIKFYQSMIENEKMLATKIVEDQTKKHEAEKKDILKEMDAEKDRLEIERQKLAAEKKTLEAEKNKAKEESFSLSNIFSGFKSEKSNKPSITIDGFDDSGHGHLVEVNKAPEQPVEDQQKSTVQSDSKTSGGEQSQAEKEGSRPEVAEDKDKDDDANKEASNLRSENQQNDAKAVTIEENKEKHDSESEETADDADPSMEIGSLLEGDIENEEQLKKVLQEKYIPKVVAAIINYALKLRSSDVHIEAGAKDLRVRYRVDGILRDIAKLPLSMHPPMISRIKILSMMKIDETRIPQDGRFDVKFKNREVDVRVSALPTVHGEKIVMRVLDKDQGVLSLEDLGMLGRAFDLTIENIAKPYGVILSTGPTGSGKSTTLYAILNRISTPAVNIITLEDPVEYEIPGINQCQIKPSIGFTFAEGLRSVLRQDPNIVMVGEIRDGETAGMATHAALTGHLVLSTLHTNDASGALPRLINMGIEPFLITSSINEIIAQRLVRRICPKCKEEMKVPQSLLAEIKAELDLIPKSNKQDCARIKTEMKFYHGVGCDECNQGYRGRVGIFEVLRMTDKIEELAISRRSANEIMQASIEDGMITMRQDGILKCLEGATTIDEIYRATSTK